MRRGRSAPTECPKKYDQGVSRAPHPSACGDVCKTSADHVGGGLVFKKGVGMTVLALVTASGEPLSWLAVVVVLLGTTGLMIGTARRVRNRA